MNDPSVTELVVKSADELVVGDRISALFLPLGEGRVIFVDEFEMSGTRWVFVAYAQPSGNRDGTVYLADSPVRLVAAADPTGQLYSRPDNDPQPSAGREPLHTGAVTDHGLIEVNGSSYTCPDHPGPLDDARDHVCRLRPARDGSDLR